MAAAHAARRRTGRRTEIRFVPAIAQIAETIARRRASTARRASRSTLSSLLLRRSGLARRFCRSARFHDFLRRLLAHADRFRACVARLVHTELSAARQAQFRKKAPAAVEHWAAVDISLPHLRRERLDVVAHQ